MGEKTLQRGHQRRWRRIYASGEGCTAGNHARRGEDAAEKGLRVRWALSVSDDDRTHLHEHGKRDLQVG